MNRGSERSMASPFGPEQDPLMLAEDEAVSRDLVEELERFLEEPDDPEPGEEIAGTARIFTDFYQSLLDAHEAAENDPAAILLEDDYLLEEFTDKLSFVSFLENTLEEPKKENIEAAYYTLFDTSFELAKIVNPLGGFGKDRLITAMDLVDSFEDEYWPLSVMINKENAQAFGEMIPESLLSEVLSGNKKALGALRCKAGHTYAAGAAVFSKNTQAISNEGFLSLEWIYVPGQFRQEGVGNFLMASLCSTVLKEKASYLEIMIPVRDFEDDEEKKDFSVFENFLDSWGFRFSFACAGEEGTKIRLCYHGMLEVPFPSMILTNREWEELRKTAGLSDDKIPWDRGKSDRGEEELKALEELLTV